MLLFLTEQGYSVVLPEKLQTGKWNVYRFVSSTHSWLLFLPWGYILYQLTCRSAKSPLKLVSRFADKPEIATLHDNFLWAPARVLVPLLSLIFFVSKNKFFFYFFNEYVHQLVISCERRHSAKTFPDHKYLGTRVRDDGTIGEWVSKNWCWIIGLKLYSLLKICFCRYKWMTYGEVSTARSAIGSGLVLHGIPKARYIHFFPQIFSWIVSSISDCSHCLKNLNRDLALDYTSSTGLSGS